ncbi:MAG: hypothetical protein AAGA54_27070 [Myxococcota bacterium]
MRASVLLLLAACACHAVPATSEGAYGQRRFVAEGGTYAIDYLTPPWEVRGESVAQLELEVPPEVFGVPLEGTAPTHAFQIGHVDALGSIDGFVDDEDDENDGDTDDAFDSDFDAPELEDEVPDYFIGLDLRDPYAVALAELTHLIDAENAEIDREVSVFTTPTGATAYDFQVQMSPGIFVRSFYVDARPTVVRAAFVSLFDLDTYDVDEMARSVDTVSGGGR